MLQLFLFLNLFAIHPITRVVTSHCQCYLRILLSELKIMLVALFNCKWCQIGVYQNQWCLHYNGLWIKSVAVHSLKTIFSFVLSFFIYLNCLLVESTRTTMLSESSSVNSGEIKSEQMEPTTSNSQRITDWGEIYIGDFGQPADNETRSAPDATDSAESPTQPAVPTKRPRIQAPENAATVICKTEDSLPRFVQPAEPGMNPYCVFMSRSHSTLL